MTHSIAQSEEHILGPCECGMTHRPLNGLPPRILGRGEITRLEAEIGQVRELCYRCCGYHDEEYARLIIEFGERIIIADLFEEAWIIVDRWDDPFEYVVSEIVASFENSNRRPMVQEHWTKRCDP